MGIEIQGNTLGILLEYGGRLVMRALDERAKRRLEAMTPAEIAEAWRGIEIRSARDLAEEGRTGQHPVEPNDEGDGA